MGFFDRFKKSKSEKADDPIKDQAEQQTQPVVDAEKAEQAPSTDPAPNDPASVETEPAETLSADPEPQEDNGAADAADKNAPVEDTDIEPEVEAAPKKKSWFSRLKDGLGKSANKITSNLAIFGKPKLDANDLEDIEDALIMADLGVAAAGRLAAGLNKRDFPEGVNQDTLSEALAEEVAGILAPVAKPLAINPDHKPHVVMMVGVNGSGKTTTAGKLAEQWRQDGLKVTMAAADTFRAAAVEQLKIWGERTGTIVISGEPGSDAAAVAYQAYEQAINEKADVLIVDTAGRLQAKKELMDELEKICRVIAKKDDAAPP